MAAAVNPTEARFPAVPARAGHYESLRAGHYESFFLRLCHPGEPLGAWIRYTVHKRPREAPLGSLWFTLFEDAGPRASKVTLPEPAAGAGEWIRVGEARIGPGMAVGGAEAGVAWDLRFDTDEPPLCHLPRDWMYGARLPRTKLLTPSPAARFDGRLSVDGREIAVRGWRGMVGHNWGAQHAERWIWLHGLFPDGAWLARRRTAASSFCAEGESRCGGGFPRRACASWVGSMPTPTAPSTTPSTARSRTCACR